MILTAHKDTRLMVNKTIRMDKGGNANYSTSHLFTYSGSIYKRNQFVSNKKLINSKPSRGFSCTCLRVSVAQDQITRLDYLPSRGTPN